MKTYTLQEAEALTGVLAVTLRQMLHRGKLQGVKVANGNREVWHITEDVLATLIPKEENTGTNYTELVTEWCHAMRNGWLIGRPMNEKTIHNWQWYLQRLWVLSGKKPSVKAITPEWLKDTFASMPVNHEERRCGYGHKMNMYKAARSFTKFLAMKRHIPMQTHDALKEARPSKRFYPARQTVLNAEQTKALLEANLNWREARTEYQRHLMHTAFCLMIYGGLRAMEVINLKLADVDLNNRVMLLFGKGNKYRKVGICPELAEALTVWIKRYRPATAKAELLTNKKGAPLTYNQLRITMGRMRQRVGFDITLHGLRRTFATENVNHGGMPLPFAQVALGHSDIKTTMGYVKTNENDAVNWLATSGCTQAKPTTQSTDELLLALLTKKAL